MNDSLGIVQRNERGQLLPGSILNPPGMRQGTRHFSTLFREAIKKIDSSTGDSTDMVIVKAVLNKAKKGDLNAVGIVREEVDGPLPKPTDKEAGSIYNITVINFDEYSNSSQPPPRQG